MIILLFITRVIFIGILEFLDEWTDQNTEDVLMNLTIFWNMKV